MNCSSLTIAQTNTTIICFNDINFLPYYYQMFLVLFGTSIIVVGVVHFLIGIFSFRVFRCSIKILFIPLLAIIVGILHAFLQVLMLSLVISGIYTSVLRIMSVYEAVTAIFIISFISLFLSSGLCSRCYFQFL